MDDKLEFFKQRGYYVQHNALQADEVSSILAGLAESETGTRGHNGDIELLERTTAVDPLIYHPSVYPTVERILGPGALCCGFTWSPRAPKTDLQPPAEGEDLNECDPLCLARQWHREDSGNIEGAALNDFMCPAVQVFFYFDDVGPESHCTSTIPESAETKRRKPKTRRPLERDGRKHDGLLRIDDYGPHGPVAEEWKTAVGSYISETKPTWVDGHGREMARRVGGVDVYTKAGGAL